MDGLRKGNSSKVTFETKYLDFWKEKIMFPVNSFIDIKLI